MPPVKMHADEIETSAALVGRLMAAQFPQWAGRPVVPVPSAGTDNALYRVGDDLVARLPRVAWAVGQAAKEQQWLPRLAPRLPLAVPVPRVSGAPGEGYPWPWAVYSWLPGENAALAPPDDPRRAARDLATFIVALQRIDAAGGPRPAEAGTGRGRPLAAHDTAVRAAVAGLRVLVARGDEQLDLGAAVAVWDAALAAPAWAGPPVWLHGDLLPGNLLVTDGRLSGIIDFGCLVVGDPAYDLLPAWALFDGPARVAFRVALGEAGGPAADEATWTRGRGWALAWGLVALPYYHRTNPALAAVARRAITAAMGDSERAAAGDSSSPALPDDQTTATL